MLKSQNLLKEIESCRREMVSLALHSSFSDQKVLKLSIELDFLLNQYEKYYNKKN